MHYLFIGGPRDGQRIEILGEPEEVRFSVLVSSLDDGDDVPDQTPLRQVRYRREFLAEGLAERYVVYVTGEGGVIAQLLAGYASLNSTTRIQ